MRNRAIHLLSWVLCALVAAGLTAPRAMAQTTGVTTGGATTGGTTGGTTTGGSGTILSSGGSGFNAGGSGTSGAAGATGGTGSGVAGSFATSGTTTSARTGAFNTSATGSTNSTSITNPTSPAASATGIPSTTNPFRTAYGSPYVVGAPISSNTSFGQPLYGKATTTNSTNTKSTTSTTPQSFSALGATRIPSYTTVLTDDFPRIEHPASEIREKVQAALLNSSFLQRKEGINVSVQDRVVLLSGQVGTEKERRIAEGMTRLTPGVIDVRNDLQVMAIASSRNNP